LAERAIDAQELFERERRFCAPVVCRLTRSSVRLWASMPSPERAI